MGSTLPSDRRPAAVHATINLDTAPTARYQPDVERIVVTAGMISLHLPPRAARALVDSLMGAVDAAEGHWEPDEPVEAVGQWREASDE